MGEEPEEDIASFPADDAMGKLMKSAEIAGYDGKFVVQSGICEDGRPFTFVVGVGDGCEILHKIIECVRQR